MSLVLQDTQRVKLTADARDRNGNPDPNVTVTWTEDSGGQRATLSAVDGDPLSTWVDAVTNATGSVNVTADAKDPDGNDVPSAPFALVVQSASTDTSTVTVTPGTPEDKPTV